MFSHSLLPLSIYDIANRNVTYAKRTRITPTRIQTVSLNEDCSTGNSFTNCKQGDCHWQLSAALKSGVWSTDQTGFPFIERPTAAHATSPPNQTTETWHARLQRFSLQICESPTASTPPAVIDATQDSAPSTPTPQSAVVIWTINSSTSAHRPRGIQHPSRDPSKMSWTTPDIRLARPIDIARMFPDSPSHYLSWDDGHSGAADKLLALCKQCFSRRCFFRPE